MSPTNENPGGSGMPRGVQGSNVAPSEGPRIIVGGEGAHNRSQVEQVAAGVIQRVGVAP